MSLDKEEIALLSPNPTFTTRQRGNPHTGIRAAALVLVFVTFVGLDFVELGGKEHVTSKEHLQSQLRFMRLKDKVARQLDIPQISIKSGVVRGISYKEQQLDSNEEEGLPIQGKQDITSTTPAKWVKQDHSSNEGGGAGALSQDSFVWRAAPWKGEVGRWLERCGGSSAPVTVEEGVYSRPCPGGCSGHGVCNHELGWCRCTQGYKGPDCAELDDYPCNRNPNAEFPFGDWVASLCAAHCDNRTARCLCGPSSPYPDRPAVTPCGLDQEELKAGRQRLDKDLMYSNSEESPGWCMADPETLLRTGNRPRQACYCNYDGRDGPLCETRTLAFCLGGCNNHGVCHRGYCECKGGWYGVDCSIPSQQTSLGHNLPLWLKGVEKAEEGEREEGQAATRRRLLETSQIRTVQRPRPLIYVYELAPKFDVHQLQGRTWKFYCVPWTYDLANATAFNLMLHGMEIAIYEAMLASPHRTTNADEADYFFVPVLSSCMMDRGDDSPRFSIEPYKGRRSSLVASYVMDAYEYIKEEFPYWNRHEGRDHIWVFSWDEGACLAPQAIWNSIMLSQWGNTMTKHNTSTTAYAYDEWNSIPLDIRGNHPCFDPAKDIVVPAWKAPDSRQLSQRLWEKPFEARVRLFYFNGNLGSAHQGRPEPNYSMGIRQTVAKFFASSRDVNGSLGLKAEQQVVVTGERSEDYAGELSSSRFCGVFPGDGFSSRMEDSILHGCIPVIIQDGIQLPYENMMDYDAFAIRIAEDDIPNMIDILKAIPEERVRAMLAAAQALWLRWSFLSVARLEASRQRLWHGHQSPWATEVEKVEGDDAMSTIMQILHYKLHNDHWRKLTSDFGKSKDFGIPPECIASNHRQQI